MNLGGFNISEESRCFIVAELSANHNGDYELALETIKAMKNSGADAVKFQTFSPDTLTIDCDNKYFKIGGDSIWKGETLYNLYKGAMMPWDWQEPLKNFIEELGMICFSTPTDQTSVDFLAGMDMPFYKLASFEITNIELIEYIAKTGKPIIFSTGISTYQEIEDAITACKKNGNNDYIFLKCTSAYPAPFDEVDLLSILTLKKKFKCPIGLSDHTMGHVVALGAVALGAKIVEKHFILDRKLGGPDSSFSMEPHEFKLMVDNIRILEKSLGQRELSLSKKAKENIVFASSLFVVTDMTKGELFTSKNIRAIRPGFGMKPKYLKNVLGKSCAKNIEKGTPLSQDLIL